MSNFHEFHEPVPVETPLGTGRALLVERTPHMILIAGSEMGQRVVQSEQVKGIVDPGLDLVKSWIAEETAKLKGKKKD